MIAYHYPPVQVSSGLQRTLSFSRYLPESGWQPLILTASENAYPATCSDQLQDIPANLKVKRAFSLDTARHLSFKGRYFNWLALPDRWISWLPFAVIKGWRMIRHEKPSVIWSTYPIATAHLIGWALHRLTGLPWIADFRDSMVDEVFPSAGIRRRVYQWIEKKAAENCDLAVFTTPGAVELYKQRYPDLSDDKWCLIPNGYNEQIFKEVEQQQSAKPDLVGTPLTLIHSGVLYPSERDPVPFFQAIAELKAESELSAQRVCIVLRATGHDELYSPLLIDAQIDDVVKLAPEVPYREALSEMLQAGGLLIFQASNCNHQIPAKLYEYFRARRPILALTDKQGDTAKALSDAGIKTVVALDDKDAIKTALLRFIYALEENGGTVCSDEIMNQYSRKSASKKLGVLLDRVCCDRK
ncbi:glycosyltransferase family 4 protein [Neptunomonas sp.]|uniref:glycosyltransferase family 4 protein n=1 Tax=Neptunomonas sp. TaxID=1971898 RepID=UPI003566C262